MSASFYDYLDPPTIQYDPATGGYIAFYPTTLTPPAVEEVAAEEAEEQDESGDPATKRLIASVLPRNGGVNCKYCGGHVKHAKFVRMALMCGFCDRPMGGL